MSPVSSRLDGRARQPLLSLLEDTVDHGLTRFLWLRQHQADDNASALSQRLDRLDWIKKLEISAQVIECIPPHRIARLRRQGHRYCGDGMPDLAEKGEAPPKGHRRASEYRWPVMSPDVV